MKYIDGFRHPAAARAVAVQIGELAARLERGREVRVMEVCGSHTMAIARYGIRSLLPANVKLISGPGCPVCVTDAGYIDAAIELAAQGICLATFGDMMKVPGSQSTLSQCRAEGGLVQVCYSPLDALALAQKSPEKEVVFLAIGFETTTAPAVGMLQIARNQGIKNIALLTAFKVIPPAMEILAADPEVKINAFLCPAHVSAIIGARAYQALVDRFSLPCVVAGFEPLDILYGLSGIVEQLVGAVARVENQYNRVVKDEGNRRAQALIAEFLEPVDVGWRGLGVLPRSGLALRGKYADFDAQQRHRIKVVQGKPNVACRCGDVLKGMMTPAQCPLFGKGCTPQHPVGPCMVSSEGSCAADYKYSGTAA